MFWWVTVPRPIVRVPHRPRPRQQPAGVEVEVRLGVGADPARRGEQQRDVDARSARAAATDGAGAAAAASTVAARAAVTDGGGGVVGERAHDAGGRRLPRELAGAGERAGGQPARAGRRRRATRARAPPSVGGGAVGEQAADAVAHGVDVAGDAGGDRRRAAGGRLGERHAPALPGRRRGDDPRPPVEVDELVVAEVPGEARPSARRRGSRTSSSRAGPLVALADDRRARGRGPCARASAHAASEQVVALHRHEPADGDDERVRRPRLAAGREAGIDAGRHDVDALGAQPQLLDDVVAATTPTA